MGRVTALLVVVLSVAALYALVGLYAAYLAACTRLARRADARHITRITTPQKGETP